MKRIVLLAALLSVSALAQDVSAPPTPTVTGLTSPDDNVLAAVGVVVKLAQEGRWAPAVVLGLFLAVWAFRKFALKLIPGDVGAWLRGKWGGWLINFTLALLGGFGSAALAHMQMSVGSVVGIIMGAVTFTLGAAGFNELTKDATAKADAAQAKGEASVVTLEDAANVMKGPPQS